MADSIHVYTMSSALSEGKYTKAGNSFIGWSKNKDSQTAEYQDKGQVLFNSPSEMENKYEITLYAIWKPCIANTYNDGSSKVCSDWDSGYKSEIGASACTKTKLTIRYNANGGTAKTSTQTTDGKTKYTWTQDSSGVVSISINGGTPTQDIQTFNYDSTTVNLWNYNNGAALYISKLGYGAVSKQVGVQHQINYLIKM